MKIYLAGPITGSSYAEATGWREEAAEKLRRRGLVGFSPLRGKKYLAEFRENIPGGGPALEQELSTPAAIVMRDFYDVQSSEAVLFYLLGAKRVSIGTMREMAWAFDYKKPAVLVMEPRGNIHEHWFVRQMCGIHAETLDEGIALLCHLVLP